MVTLITVFKLEVINHSNNLHHVKIIQQFVKSNICCKMGGGGTGQFIQNRMYLPACWLLNTQVYTTVPNVTSRKM